jgi:hypothetical protein
MTKPHDTLLTEAFTTAKTILAATEYGSRAAEHATLAAFALAESLTGWANTDDDQWMSWCLKATEEEILDEGLRQALLHMEPCSPGCPGWAHFDVGTDREAIQRCDACARYQSDVEAAKAHDAHCRCGMGAGLRAERCHACEYSVDDVEPVSVTSDERMVCQQCQSEAALDAAGRRCGLNADWYAQTWEIDSWRGLYICDCEDALGTYELVHRRIDMKADEWVDTSVLASTDAATLAAIAKDYCEVTFARGTSKTIGNCEIDLTWMTGTVVEGDDQGRLVVKLDQHRPELDEWDNCLIWEDDERPALGDLFTIDRVHARPREQA